MKKPLKRLISIFAATLTALLLSTTVWAQTEIDISDRNLVRVGGDVTVAPNRTVENAVAIGGDVILEEEARATQTAIALGGDVILERDARVDGDAYAVGGEIIAAEGATILGGSRTFTEDGRWGMHGARRRGVDGFGFYYISKIVSHLLTVLLSAIVGVLILRWRPDFLPNLAATVRQAPLQCLFWGLGGVAAAILLGILLTISLFGIPLLPLLGIGVAIAVLLGTLGVALWIGERTQPRRALMSQFFVGILVLALIGLVPFLGGLILSVANLVGLGALLTRVFDKRQSQPIG
ncbi:MAG: hypothetical protein KME17_25620 [Cyanosarcina radialis HA8281-LM2]|jgi:hypothetical protein|nr:hypothetical protein [Cyanosarcina radialis HA8281-LM2]